MRRKRNKKYMNTEPKIDVDNLVVDTTRRERFQIFEVLASKRKELIVFLIFSGALSIFFFAQLFMGAQFFTSLNFIALAATGFIGVANIIFGLLLLASE
jgi:hypothetical protein